MFFRGLVFAVFGFGLSLAYAASSSGPSYGYASGPAGNCPSGATVYSSYDGRCSTPYAANAQGQVSELLDVTLGPTSDGAQLTTSIALGTSIASVKTSDGFEFIMSGNHGSSFTLDLNPDVPSLGQGYQYVSACNNPTEEGNQLDDQRSWTGTPLGYQEGPQGHGMSTSAIDGIGAGSQHDANNNWQYDWYESASWLANWWYAAQGYNSQLNCSAPSYAGAVSNFSEQKNVRLGQLTDANGTLLDSGFANYITLDRVIYMVSSEPTHGFIAVNTPTYLATAGIGGSNNYFQNFCIMTGSNLDTTCTTPNPSNSAVSGVNTQPVVASDSTGTHAIGVIAEIPYFVTPPGNANNTTATIAFENQFVQIDPSPFGNTIMSVSMDIQNAAPRGDGQPTAFHVRAYYAVGTQAQVIQALANIRQRMQNNIAINF